MAKQIKTDIFERSVFRYTFNNVPIPELNANSKVLAEAIETDSILYSIQSYKARQSSRILPIISKEVAGEKSTAKEFKKWNGKYVDKYERIKLKELRNKAFEEIYLDDINERNNLYGLKKLLTKPNQYQTFAQLMEAYSFNIDQGWCPLWGDRLDNGINRGKYQSLYVLPSHLVDIIGGTQFDPITAYRFKHTYQKDLEFLAEDVIRISTYSPRYDGNGEHLRGISKIKVAWDDFQVRVKSLERKYTNFSNGDLRSLIMPKEGHNWGDSAEEVESQTRSLKDSIIRAFRQILPQRIGFLGTPVDVHHFQNEVKEVLLKDAEEMAIRIACSVWGIDQTVVFPTNEGTTYDNQQVMTAKALRNGVFPDLIKFEENINEYLVKPYYDGHSIMFDYDVYEELNNDIFKEIDALSKADWIPDNVKLRWIDQEPIDDERAEIPSKYWEMAPPIEPLGLDGEL
jgi:hypothetical protein